VAATYILNQLVDLETDRGNGGLPLLAKAGISPKLAAVETALLALVPAAYALFLSGPVSFFLLLALVLNLLYNVRPFYFTGRPFLDFLTNAAGFGLVAFGLGWASAGNGLMLSVSRYLHEAAPYVFLMVAGSINSTIPDIEGDKRTGKRTTAVLLGARRANFISTAAIAAAFIFAALNRDVIAGITSSLSLPFFIRYLYSDKLKDGLHTFQICGSFLMVLTVAVFPRLFVWGLAVYVLTRLYFRLRHHIDYPKLGV
jgi:4-hydroxybenzoate polyprenyltransferase